jgi:hypothetical protein
MAAQGSRRVRFRNGRACRVPGLKLEAEEIASIEAKQLEACLRQQLRNLRAIFCHSGRKIALFYFSSFSSALPALL